MFDERAHLAPYCLGDQRYFEALSRLPDEDDRFAAAAYPTPEGWERHERDWWIHLGPTDVELPKQGWKIHVSSTAAQADWTCEIVWRFCVANRVAFKFWRSRRAMRFMNGPLAPRTGSGKFFTLYPSDDVEMAGILTALGSELTGVEGPYILSDLRIGDGPLHVRYGAFIHMTCRDDDGELVPAMEGPDGELVPDRREPFFHMPEWVETPAILRSHLDRFLDGGDEELPYRIERVIKYGNGGGVYRAVDTSGRKVVLLEGRPHAGVDDEGVDAVARLRRQAEVLERLSGLPAVPRLIGRHRLWEHEYLAVEQFDGQTLIEEALTRYPLILDMDPSAEVLTEYTDWVTDVLAKVEKAVLAVHEKGVRHGDIHPDNIVVRPDGEIALIDFEYARGLDEPMPPVGAAGFVPPDDLGGAAADWYQFDCVRMHLFIPLELRPDLAPHQFEHVTRAIEENFGVLADVVIGRSATRWRRADDADRDPARLFTAPELDWTAIRDSIAAGISGMADLSRTDRLFPGGAEVYQTGGHTLAHGAAGVLYALHRSGAAIDPEHVDWLRRAARVTTTTSAGFYDGLHGTAHVLDLLGHRDEALELLVRAERLGRADPDPGLFGGRCGAALNLLHFARATGYDDLRERALEIARDVEALLTGGRTPLRAPSVRGLMRGMTGAALLFLRLYDDHAENRYLDLARAALRIDLEHGEYLDNGTFQLKEAADYDRFVIYLDGGSAGPGILADQYLRFRPDEALARLVDAVRTACRAPFVREPGLLRGRSGFVVALGELGLGLKDSAIETHVRRLAWYAQPVDGYLAFPGAKLLRLSADLATGAAGVLLALNSVFEEGVPEAMPFLGPWLTHPDDERR